MATITTQTDSSNQSLTLDVSSLASSDTFLAGVESAQVDNTANNYVDAIVTIEGIAGHASTAPAIGDQMRVYLWGADTSLATTAYDVLDGTSSAETLSHGNVLSSLHLAASVSVPDATANRTYWMQPFSVASFFGGRMPKYWGLFFAHNLGATLAASQTGKFGYYGITYTNT